MALELTRTGVKATELELEEALRLYKESLGTPFLFKPGKGNQVFLASAQKKFHEFVHKAALEHGLPEIEGYYGIDTVSFEFVRYT